MPRATIPPGWEGADNGKGCGERPNCIWIFGDQHRAQALGCMGDQNLHTPNIADLAMQGVFCRGGAVAGYPLCCPYRGSLLTSRYPHRCVPGHQFPMPPEQPTVAHAFDQAGYHTAWFGKWHLDGHRESDYRAAFHIVPPERRGGFHEWCGYENNNSQWDCWVHGGEGETAYHERLPGYETDALTERFIDYLRRRSDAPEQPFFAALSVQPPHDPFVAPPEHRRLNPGEVALRPNVPPGTRIEAEARRGLAGYYGMIENLDWNIGRVLTALRESGLARNTHVLFFSDHGEMLGCHGMQRKQLPYEESIRVPFVIGGGVGYLGRTGMVDGLINHVDVAPTSLGLCGVPVPDWMEGHDFSHLRLGGQAPEDLPDSAFLQQVVPTGHASSCDQPWRGVITADGWKYACLPGQDWLLFDLNDDPYEFCNLAPMACAKPQRDRLLARLREWIAETGDDFALPH